MHKKTHSLSITFLLFTIGNLLDHHRPLEHTLDDDWPFGLLKVIIIEVLAATLTKNLFLKRNYRGSSSPDTSHL